MIYILNTNFNNKKKISFALTQIFGLGKHNSSQICDLLGISTELRLKQLSPLQLEQLTQIITENFDIGSEIKRSTMKDIKRLVKIASYRGFRHIEGLPARGQRTHGNSRTVRNLKHQLANHLKKR